MIPDSSTTRPPSFMILPLRSSNGTAHPLSSCPCDDEERLSDRYPTLSITSPDCVVVSCPVGRATTVVLGVVSVDVAGAAGGCGGIGGAGGGESRVLSDHLIWETFGVSLLSEPPLDGDGRKAIGLFKNPSWNVRSCFPSIIDVLVPALLIKSINRFLARSPTTIPRASSINVGSTGVNATPGRFTISRNSLVVNDT